jgi:hypothetical protein
MSSIAHHISFFLHEALLYSLNKLRICRWGRRLPKHEPDLITVLVIVVATCNMYTAHFALNNLALLSSPGASQNLKALRHLYIRNLSSILKEFQFLQKKRRV